MRILAILGVSAFAVGLASAQTPPPKTFASERPTPTTSPVISAEQYPAHVRVQIVNAGPCYVPEQLLRMDECQLMEIYKNGVANPVPNGYTPGTVIFRPGSAIVVPASKMFRFTAWQGKWIECGVMTNRQFGVPAIKAAISDGTSWIDGKPSQIFDYEDTSLICARYRDEVREICPGIYLGCMHKRTKSGPEIAVWFALDARKLKGCCPNGQKK
jgi:hypothetical protein